MKERKICDMNSNSALIKATTEYGRRKSNRVKKKTLNRTVYGIDIETELIYEKYDILEWLTYVLIFY